MFYQIFKSGSSKKIFKCPQFTKVRCKVLLQKWGGHLKNSQDLSCESSFELHTMQHLLQRPLLEQVYAHLKICSL